ncbi:MAG: low-co2 inducible protein lcib [Nitrospirales bacterium]|nr:MAG: low-co2 inducible protein lcib [Nitrospirales bacterium]
MGFEETVETHFPGAMRSSDYIQRTSEALHGYGFHATNAIVCASVCRDELTRNLIEEIEKAWTHVFDFSSLAGMLYLGKTGFKTASHHSPNEDGEERVVYFAFPHISIDAEGVIGNCYRSGRKDVSHACGALFGLQKELANGSITLDFDSDDIELSLLKQRMLKKIRYGEVPDLVTLTKIAHSAIREDLERMIYLTVNNDPVSYAVFTGVQIHGPDNQTWIWTDTPYVVVKDDLEKLTKLNVMPKPLLVA